MPRIYKTTEAHREYDAVEFQKLLGIPENEWLTKVTYTTYGDGTSSKAVVRVTTTINTLVVQ